MSNCPNCLASNPFKKVDRDGAVIEICEYCNTIKEEECEEYPKKQVQNKSDTGLVDKIYYGWLIFMVVISVIVIGFALFDAFIKFFKYL
ncbi:hypothetical protein [Lysinibacillus sp. NPDC086135]|uniref:hypothetical protein n=1 Tax=Lysinibacillus sp. NPDC086135 TaxID=3364130 RepID=UPI00382E58D8